MIAVATYQIGNRGSRVTDVGMTIYRIILRRSVRSRELKMFVSIPSLERDDRVLTESMKRRHGRRSSSNDGRIEIGGQFRHGGIMLDHGRSDVGGGRRPTLTELLDIDITVRRRGLVDRERVRLGVW